MNPALNAIEFLLIDGSHESNCNPLRNYDPKFYLLGPKTYVAYCEQGQWRPVGRSRLLCAIGPDGEWAIHPRLQDDVNEELIEWIRLVNAQRLADPKLAQSRPSLQAGLFGRPKYLSELKRNLLAYNMVVTPEGEWRTLTDVAIIEPHDLRLASHLTFADDGRVTAVSAPLTRAYSGTWGQILPDLLERYRAHQTKRIATAVARAMAPT